MTFGRKAAPVVLAVLGLTVLPAMAQNALPLCRAVAARLGTQRAAFLADPELTPLKLLSRGPAPIVMLATGSGVAGVPGAKNDMLAQQGATALGGYGAYFAGVYRPDPALAAAVAETIPFEIVRVEGFAGDPLQALSASAGSAHCSTYLFFLAPDGGAGRLAPDPPATLEGGMSEDVGAHRVECYVSEGALARIAGHDGFLVADGDPVSFDRDLRLALFDAGAWSPACMVSIAFTTSYGASNTALAAGGPVTRGDLEREGPAIARALDLATEKKPFSYGPPVPAARREAIRRVVAGIKAGTIEVPDSLPGGNGDWAVALDGADVQPVVLHGEAFVLRAAHLSMGWRALPGYSAAVYRLAGTGVEPVAFLRIEARRGPFASVRAGLLPPKS